MAQYEWFMARCSCAMHVSGTDSMDIYGSRERKGSSKGVFRFQKYLAKNITSNVCLDNVYEKKSIAQFACKLLDESFKTNCAMI